MKRLRGKDLLLVGLTLFSMFFGAGNLIFPPFLGAQAGGNTWSAMAGFLISAIGFPVLGVIAVARAGSLPILAGRVGPRFATGFAVLIYLSIGPCLAIPRTASTSFEMAVTPFLAAEQLALLPVLQFAYSLLFFAAALLLALLPEKLSDRLGKILCPCLLVLIVVVFAGCVISPPGGYGPVQELYTAHPVTQGFLDGYQTMDTMAALAFGIVILLNIQARGVEDEKEVVRGTVGAGIIAGVVLLAVYSMMAHVGALSGDAFPGAENGAQVLTRVVSALFGPLGAIILAAIFVIACFNVCVGLISSCGEYFHGLVPRISYRVWAVIFAVVSMAIANAGLNLILKVSVPILSAIYPVAIVLIVLSFFHRWLSRWRAVYPTAILCTGVASVVFAAADYLPELKNALSGLPLANLGLGWVLPAAAGIVLGLVLSLFWRE